MTDPRQPYLDIAGFAASAEANVTQARQMLDLRRNGWPRAQDFEPSGKGGSDPTGVNGTLRDDAANTIAELDRRTKRVWHDMLWIDTTLRANLKAVRPDFDASDPNEYCRVHLTELDEYVYRDVGDLCRSCYERMLVLRKSNRPEVITADDLRHHARKGRWPMKAVDPKQPSTRHNQQGRQYVATADALIAGLEQIEEAG